MAKPVCMVPGKELPDAAEDFRGAKRIEQYRISEKALYLPEGLRWKYLPFSAIDKAEESFRVISAGHCFFRGLAVSFRMLFSFPL